jgi:hypothetical protein
MAEQQTGTPALLAGIEALERAMELPFPEFTAKLVTSTFDAIIGATIHQMEAYADLIASIAKTIENFEATNITEGDVTRFLIDNYPDAQGGTCVRYVEEEADYLFETTEDFHAIFDDLVDVRLRTIWDEETILRPEDPAPNARTFTEEGEQLERIRRGLRRFLAQTKLDQLRVMAREGMARVVVSDGSILSKLTFRVATTDQQSFSYSEYTRESLSVGAAGFFGGFGGGIAGGIVAGVRYSTLKVTTTNARSYNKVTMDAQIIGEVRMNFQTQTFPPLL